MVIDADLGNHTEIIDFLKRKETTLKQQLDNVLKKLDNAEQDKTKYEEAQTEWYGWSK